jgi:cellulose synthase/poly-beta-1,6-N-acetylglucosamine synthase-like glycosyltransferase
MTRLELVLQWIFWISAGLIVYSYVAYAVLVWIASRLFGRKPVPPASMVHTELPRVSLLISAYNEAEVIEARVWNALESDYPTDKLEIVIGCDGSSDATASIVRAFNNPRVRLFDYHENRGKATVLNDSMSRLGSEIVVLSDANTFFDPSAITNLVRWFRDMRVSAVCGKLVLTDPKTGKNADSLYWKYETFLKTCEGRLGALLGSNGAIYAVRRDCYVPIPSDTIVDDFVIPLLSKVHHGGRIVFDGQAIARERTPAELSAEFHRRTRIGAGGFQSIGILWRLLLPRHGWTAITFFSHKVLRWICPFLMLAMIVANLALIRHPQYQWIAAAQAAFYAGSMLAALLPGRSAALKPLRLASMFTGMNAALFVGFFRWLRGSQKAAWRRTSRMAEGAL